MYYNLLTTFIFFLLSQPLYILAQELTYAQKLGWDKDDKLIIMHVDDAGMSYDSNQGAIKSIEQGIANSVSIMMPCPWVSSFVRYVKENPEVDAGVHLTLTAEWDNYRWEPLAGSSVVPGLVDPEGAFWPSVAQVVQHASPDEVETEIRAQVERAITMGISPTHLDSHMGTLFATEEFVERYIKVGIEYQIPVMVPGGHNTLLKQIYREEEIERLKREGKYRKGMKIELPQAVKKAPEIGQLLWDAGLPVLDDLHQVSYSWKLPEGVPQTDQHIKNLKVDKFIETFEQMKPGITMFIVHSTDVTEVFEQISGSGFTRKGDLLAMMDPRLKKYINDHQIKFTTWREMKQRRDALSTN
ncbi:MAG: polysaccharide deacetylase family protein [Candidatus Cyclobacteriaceae bacterium M3_2C_046]